MTFIRGADGALRWEAPPHTLRTTGVEASSREIAVGNALAVVIKGGSSGPLLLASAVQTSNLLQAACWSSQIANFLSCLSLHPV